MKPAAFSYLRADSTEQALEALRQQGGEARVIAGGQSLMPMLAMRLARPTLLVDIMRISALDQVTPEADAWRIGAAVRQRTLEIRPDLPRQQPLLAMVMPVLGHWQTRTRGTVCGSVAHADPSAELPLVLLALNGSVLLRNARRRRAVAAEAFFTGMMVTARTEDELIEAVSLPTAKAGTGYAFREISRRHGDFAIAAFAAVAGPDGVRLAIGGVSSAPVARPMPLDGLEDALDAFAWDLEARDYLHASARYRRELVRRIGRQVVLEAVRDRAARAQTKEAA